MNLNVFTEQRLHTYLPPTCHQFPSIQHHGQSHLHCEGNQNDKTIPDQISCSRQAIMKTCGVLNPHPLISNVPQEKESNRLMLAASSIPNTSTGQSTTFALLRTPQFQMETPHVTQRGNQK